MIKVINVTDIQNGSKRCFVYVLYICVYLVYLCFGFFFEWRIYTIDSCWIRQLIPLTHAQNAHVKVKRKWRDIRPSMVIHTRNSCSAFNPSLVHTHSSEHTHTVNTHPEQWAAIYAAVPGEQLGVRCLAQGHLSRGIEGGRERCTFTPPTYNSCRPETRNHNLLGYESDSLTIRPWLPHSLVCHRL